MKVAQKVFETIKEELEQIECRRIASKYDIHGWKRIYFVHIRKTGGTSLNNMFLSLSGKDSRFLYSQLANIPHHRVITNGIVYVGWNVQYLNEGSYFYGFSHTPLYKLSLPKQTFTISCFRDPVKRVISHYNMLMDFRVHNINHPCMTVEGKWLGENFDDFLRRIPQTHLLNQLYMFSEQCDVDEAFHRLEKLSHYFFTDEFDKGIEELNKKTGLGFKPVHIRKANYRAEISKASIAKLREMLDREYEFLDYIRKPKTGEAN